MRWNSAVRFEPAYENTGTIAPHAEWVKDLDIKKPGLLKRGF